MKTIEAVMTEEEVNAILNRAWKRIGAEMKNRAVSAEMLSDRLGISTSVIYKNLRQAKNNGKMLDTRLQFMEDICHELGHPLDWCLCDEQPAEAEKKELPAYITMLLKALFKTDNNDYTSKIMSLLPYLSPVQQNSVKDHVCSYFSA